MCVCCGYCIVVFCGKIVGLFVEVECVVECEVVEIGVGEFYCVVEVECGI